jgi:hypothetical protein
MAWSDPGDFTSGQILTAAQMDSIREAMFFGQATFTNEAARDAAIPATGIALQEGMRAYLTAPTVPAATGTTTAVPTGITAVYNGSVWVCTTSVGANSATDATTTSASYVSTLTGDATAVSVTLTTGTSVFIHYGFAGNVNTNAAYLMTFAVSGATTLAAADANAIYLGTSGTNLTGHRGIVYTGLTAGTNTFTLNYRTTGGTATYIDRWLAVSGVA